MRNGGTVIFPHDQLYWIEQRLNPIVNDIIIEWRGPGTRQNSYPIPIQNHRAGFILSSASMHINRHSTGGIHGSGNTWYTAEAGKTQEGRPMPFVFWNVSLPWAINIMNVTNMAFENMVVSVTTCHGRNGIAIGSLGRYQKDSSVQNVFVDEVNIIRYYEHMQYCVYIRIWIRTPIPQSSYVSSGLPRGGGWGNISYITFSNSAFKARTVLLRSFKTAETMEAFRERGSASCRKANPLYDIQFENVRLRNQESGTENVNGTCKYIKGGIHGLKSSRC
ncbi:glycoside hydrolase family 28 protein [Zopfia rhizophila CBS 207.26]|uniref:galacturonan 1,4-alpha-galacturonidase n=1 Tax=Zopfia rhizophila CBS 207.26 TaxID=1314779 RepID=A0A6A6DKS7_9PEZI|nr:glycoside hydrolase family 28 protein [Zopfia rhizophila CBS 207.26]